MTPTVLVCGCALLIVALTCSTCAAPAGSCLVGNRTVADGATFSKDFYDHCILYKCQGGSTLPQFVGCSRDGSCFRLNDTFQDGCLVRQCQAHGSFLGYYPITEGCHASGGCLGIGEKLHKQCLTYTCLKETSDPFSSVTYHLAITDIGCPYKNGCIPLNQTVTDGCITRRCEKHGFSVGLIEVNQACHYQGRCVGVGEKFTTDCRTYTCVKQTFGFSYFFSVRPLSVRCKDGYGQCHDSGEFFSLLMDDKIPRNCTCKVADVNVEYSCEAPPIPPVG